MWQYIYTDELYHHGIKGQKWGVRRYQNEDGSLTRAGKRRVKQYENEIAAMTKDLEKKSEKRYIDAYNKTADEYNNGKIEEYNKKHNVNAKNYEEKFNEQFDKDVSANLDKMTYAEMSKNPHYKKAQKICEKYELLKYSDLARENADSIAKIKKMYGL